MKQHTRSQLLHVVLILMTCSVATATENERPLRSTTSVTSEPSLFDFPANESGEVFHMPGEFEYQNLLLFSCGDLTDAYANTIAQIAHATRDAIRVVVLYSDDTQRAKIVSALRQQKGALPKVDLLKIPHNTIWVRDYGPTLLRRGTQFRIVDWLYEIDRPHDELVPERLATLSRTPYERATIAVSGGNLLSNGQGLYITSTAVLDDNSHRGLTTTNLLDQLSSRLNATQKDILVLERLVDEETGHVDMFATFTAANTVVVGQYTTEDEDDNEDAAILDRNAARLAAVTTPSGPLRVERIPMGARHDGNYRTYTNCIYANGILIVPCYPEFDGSRLNDALACFRRLLPAWKIVCIDATDLIEQGGALHCATLNIPGLSMDSSPWPPNPPVAKFAADATKFAHRLPGYRLQPFEARPAERRVLLLRGVTEPGHKRSTSRPRRSSA